MDKIKGKKRRKSWNVKNKTSREAGRSGVPENTNLRPSPADEHLAKLFQHSVSKSTKDLFPPGVQGPPRRTLLAKVQGGCCVASLHFFFLSFFWLNIICERSQRWDYQEIFFVSTFLNRYSGANKENVLWGKNTYISWHHSPGESWRSLYIKRCFAFTGHMLVFLLHKDIKELEVFEILNTGSCSFTCLLIWTAETRGMQGLSTVLHEKRTSLCNNNISYNKRHSHNKGQ